MEKTEILTTNGIDVEKGLELLGDMELYDEILNEFYNQTEERINNLKNYKEKEDLENYAILVHAIKSDSKYLGFNKLAELALEHELQSKAKDINFVNDNYNELLNEFNRIIEVIQLYLK